MSVLKDMSRTAASGDAARAAQEPADSREALFVVPRRGGGLQVSVRGHFLELAEPRPVHQLAPTPDDLFIASIASDLAWTARDYLHAHGLPDEVAVSAAWRRLEDPPRLADIDVTVTLPETVKIPEEALEQILAERLAARSLDARPRLHLLSR